MTKENEVLLGQLGLDIGYSNTPYQWVTCYLS